MMAPGLLGILSWAAFPVVGALLGLCVARIAARFATEPRQDRASRIIGSLLELTPVSVLARVPSPADLRPIASALLRGLLSSPDFLRSFRTAVSESIASALSWTVRDFISRAGLPRFILENALDRLADQESRRLLARSIASLIHEFPPEPPGSPAAEGLPAALASLAPVAVDRLLDGLKSPETRNVLAARGRELLPKILDKLNVLQRFLLSAGQFDRRIDEKMPEIVDETIAAMEQVAQDPSQQALFLTRLLQSVRDWRTSPSTRAEAGAAVAGLVEEALAKLAEVRSHGNSVTLVETLLGGGDQTLGAFLRLRLGIRDTELADAIVNAALSWVSRPAGQDALAVRLADAGARFIAARADTPLRTLLGISPEARARLDFFVADRLQETRRFWSAALGRRAGLFGAAAGAAIGVGIGVVEALLGFLHPPLP